MQSRCLNNVLVEYVGTNTYIVYVWLCVYLWRGGGSYAICLQKGIKRNEQRANPKYNAKRSGFNCATNSIISAHCLKPYLSPISIELYIRAYILSSSCVMYDSNNECVIICQLAEIDYECDRYCLIIQCHSVRSVCFLQELLPFTAIDVKNIVKLQIACMYCFYQYISLLKMCNFKSNLQTYNWKGVRRWVSTKKWRPKHENDTVSFT